MRKYLKKHKKTMKIFFVYALNIFLMNFKVIQVYADGDPLTVVNNLSTLAGGVVITFAKEILNTITG